jgi:glycosyltransferase involved in cell wall biosynthesis
MSEREGLSVISLESLALGTPVLLPSYSPIPDVVKDMCVVCDVDDIPDMICRIAMSNNKKRFLKRTGMKLFETSNIASVYASLFKKLGLRH